MSTNLDQVVALEIVLPNGGQLEVGDTLLPSARALNGHGDTVTSTIFWAALDTAIITVLDSTTGATLGETIGIGRLQARVGLLISNPQTVTVITHLDSVTANPPTIAPTRDTITVSQPDTISDSLQVQLYATPAIAAGRRVVFSATTFPASSPFVTLVPRDTIFSSGTGLAAVQVKIVAGGPVPDSVVVTATVQRPDGTPIPGSPVTFVVEVHP
ncbi:MAG TPA: hypothetical protein VGU74_04935 [Gemmatimonadales bacterium]|nr:hypothetical protein [Gemmatimonadales bacterium]